MEWITKNGTKIKVDDLEVTHMQNIIKRFSNNPDNVGLLTTEELREKVKSIIQELEEKLLAEYWDYKVERWKN